MDKKFDSAETNSNFQNHLFLRLIAKNQSFSKVNFKYSMFENSYIRNCRFDSCDFTGCQFIGTNMHGSTFSGCRFDYATFERTLIDSGILDTECPGFENLKSRFARTLRINYQQLGDAVAANKAMKVELKAAEIHYFKSWKSNESYYRNKYHGVRRITSFFEWSSFKILDLIWGNGESPWKLCRFVFVVMLGMTVLDVVKFSDPVRLDSYGRALASAPQVFLGVLAPDNYGKLYLTAITLFRLVFIGFFLSIIIKKFNRR
ncbi:MAG: pentapeptide repeat-containing protein [Negativicutes bacterium]|nr:pentapeptide repeat-containing protein [Negativicutes bacterium]